MGGNYTIIDWYPQWKGFCFRRPDPAGPHALFYRWYLWVGFWEVRKWVWDGRDGCEGRTVAFRSKSNG